MLISWNSTSSVKNSSVTDAGAVGIICASLSSVCGAAFGRNHFPLKAVLQTISPPVESLHPPPDFLTRSDRLGLRQNRGADHSAHHFCVSRFSQRLDEEDCYGAQRLAQTRRDSLSQYFRKFCATGHAR